MDVRAIFIDMDGTLLTANNSISKRNAEAIYKIINQGIKVFLATGRQYEITAPYHQALGLQTPMICLNGASIHDGRTGNPIQIKPIMLDKERFHQFTGENPCHVLIHTSDGLYSNQMNEEMYEWTREGRVPPRYIGNLRKANYKYALKYDIRTGSSNPSLSKCFTKEGDIIHWKDGFEIVAHGVSKWSAIKTLLRVYGIKQTEIVTIGDGPNDIQMLRHAGTGVAMANAAPKVKEAADFVTGHHEKDGLADFIEEYLVNSYAI
ncbi:HAD family hydrolase [Oceanobacillus salinisoli]|uniref:HAD family hydrolase n=1 Tax=Oceanobacillus salinisoli TaxID=2678611 RepID=UPI0012E11CEA|nr:HAD family hydrolase [Oceanobacillus salinisoli]